MEWRRVASLCLLAGCANDPSHMKGGLVAIAGLSTAAVEQAIRPRKIALLVGVDEFIDPFWPRLRYATKDATDLARVLRDPKIGAFDHVVVLSSAGDTDRARVERAIAELGEHARKRDDLVLVYISAHGTLTPEPDGSVKRTLVLRDTRHNDLRRTGLSVDRLIRELESLPSERNLLILATCHSGSGKSLLTPDVAAFVAGTKGPPTLESVSTASIVLSAADFGQPAREDDRLANDVYTHFLVRALTQGADANGDGAVTATEAHDWARQRTFEFTEGRQVPVVESVIAGSDPFVLAGRVERRGLPVIYGYDQRLAGLDVRVNGRSKGALPGNVVLEPGHHDLELVATDGTLVASSSIDLADGERLSALRIVERAGPRYTLALRLGAIALVGGGISEAIRFPVPSAVVALRARDLPFEDVEMIFDASVGYSSQTLTPAADSTGQPARVPQSVLVAQVGGSIAGRFELGPLLAYAGPRIGYLFVERVIAAEGLAERQHLGAPLLGALVLASLPLGSFNAELEVDAHYAPVSVDGRVEPAVEMNVLFGAGYRF